MNSTEITNTFELIRILTFLTILFVLIPFLIRKPEKGKGIENAVKGFGASVFSGIIAAYSLTATRLYGLVPFLVLFFLTVVFVYLWGEGIKIKELKIKERAITFAVKIFNSIEKTKGMSLQRKQHKQPEFSAEQIQKPAYKKSEIFLTGITIFVFIYTFLIRLIEVIPHTFLYYSDSYGHLMITKLFLTGKIMLEKFYPLGYHSIISGVKTVSFCDLADIIRFLGPIQSTIAILVLYWFIYMVTKNKYAALLSASILGMDSLDVWTLVFYRQLVALPQEFATIFFMPTIYFCVQYLIKQDKKDLKYFFIFLCNIFLTHLYVGILVFWVLLGVFISGILLKLWRKDTFIKTLFAGTASCAVGGLPFIIWMILGLIFNLPNRHGEIVPDGGFFYRYFNFHVKAQNLTTFLYDALNPFKDIAKWHNQLSANIIIYSLLFSILYLFFRCLFRKKFFQRHIFLLSLTIGQIFFAIFYYGFKYNLISIMYFERIGLVLSICGTVIVGLLFNEVWKAAEKFFKNAFDRTIKPILGVMVYTVIIATSIFFPYEKPETVVYQHEGVLKAYYQMKKEFELLDWTVVSPVEEFSLVYGYGYHYELWKFLKDFSINDAKDRNFNFGKRLPSKNICIIFEKEPLLVWYAIPETVYHISETERYYRMYHERKRLERKLYEWVDEYKKSHIGLSSNAKVFYEDTDIIVYHIENDTAKK